MHPSSSAFPIAFYSSYVVQRLDTRMSTGVVYDT